MATYTITLTEEQEARLIRYLAAAAKTHFPPNEPPTLAAFAQIAMDMQMIAVLGWEQREGLTTS
jgi:hypothetical protein